MQSPENGKARYYAFISHKSTDARFALKLQKFIEAYNLPTNIRQMAGIHDRRLTPLCSYEVDFSSSPLLEEMQDKLARSNYLILLCSEELVKSDPKYINYEIRTFIECKKAEGIDPLKRIIPIIITGAFGSQEHECCPEALRELGDSCPIALDRKKYKNDRELFLHVISSLLNVDYAVLENRDKKRQRTRKQIWATVLFLLLTTLAVLGEYFIPRQSRYVDFVMKNGLPEGIGPLTEGDCQRMKGHYVITRQKHKIQSLEYVNAYGNRIDHGENVYDGDRPSAYRFAYTDAGLSTVTYEDRFGEPYFLLQYSGNSVSAGDLRDPYDPGEAFYIGSGYETDPAMLLADINLDARSDISRFRYTYSPEGYVTEVIFCSDSTGRLAQDNSVYGFSYGLDEKGRITETYFLDALGQRRLNSEGLYCRKFTYDDRDDLIKWVNYDQNGIPAADEAGIVQCLFSYDEYHNLTELSFLDMNGAPVQVAGYGGAGQLQQVDDRGNPILVTFLDETGAPGSLDYSAMAMTYDENGYLESRTFLDPEGKAVISASLNYAAIRYDNDESGNPLEVTYYDAQGNLLDNAYGYAKEIRKYDHRGRIIKHSYFRADGTAADYRGYGYASLETAYDDRGREISTSYFGSSGEPVNISGPIFGFGYHRLEAAYEYGAHTKQTLSYYSADGSLTNMHSSLGEEYARSVIYIQNGEITHMTNYRSDGSIYGDILESETTRSAQAEPITTYRYTDSSGNLLQEFTTCFRINGVEKQKTSVIYDEAGNIASKTEALYHENGQRRSDKTTEYHEDGSILTQYLREFDEAGRVLTETLVEPDSPDYHTYTVCSTYDEEGNLAEEIHTTLRADGSTDSVVVHTYEPDGSESAVKFSVFAENGSLSSETLYAFENQVKVSAREQLYNDSGTVIMVTAIRYRPDGSTETVELTDYSDTGMPEAHTRFQYHEDGTATQTTSFYDETGAVISTTQRQPDESNHVSG